MTHAPLKIGAGVVVSAVTLSVCSVLYAGLNAEQGEALALERLRSHIARGHNYMADHQGDMPQARKHDTLDLAPPGAENEQLITVGAMRQTVGLWPALLRDYFGEQPIYPGLYSPGLIDETAAVWDLDPGPIAPTGPGGWPSFQWNHRILGEEPYRIDDFRHPSRTCVLIDVDVAYLDKGARNDRRAGAFVDGHASTHSAEEWEKFFEYGQPRRFGEGRR